jgi:hypothetical protein
MLWFAEHRRAAASAKGRLAHRLAGLVRALGAGLRAGPVRVAGTGLQPYPSVDPFSQQVGVADMAGVLLDHVDQYLA